MKWEYTVIYLAHFELFKEANSLVDVLNEYGQMGWNLVAVDNGVIYFKRAMGVDLSHKIMVGAAVEEMANIMDEAVSRLARRKANA